MDPLEEGKIYFLKHGAEYKNPYPRGTVEYNKFERGWSQALKSNPHLINASQKDRKSSRISSNKSAAEDYLNARKK